METKFIEFTNGPQNWGKFLVGRFTESELDYRSQLMLAQRPKLDTPLLRLVGWQVEKVLLVVDLQTGEGAVFTIDKFASAKADLEKHKVWVCPLFEPFLEWLYRQDLTDLSKLPSLIDLPGAPFAFSGYRRSGRTKGKAQDPPKVSPPQPRSGRTERR